MPKEIDISCAKIIIRDDGIMHVHIKLEYSLEMEHSKAIVEARTKLADGHRYPIMYTATQFLILSNDSREYLASESRSTLVIADAFVINSLPQRLLARLYKKFNKPVRPAEIFENENDAIEWLKQFVETKTQEEEEEEENLSK